ncbi:hypothetical protein K474DRAFT_1480866 [Panus rudis PR-1116 ss-1]|nr:hypothetical protein K474DRAFT_1480866 [Panus rudis PR-1116 ss-1]
MAPEIKFTSFGIPYLVEFANVKFRSALRKRKPAVPPKPKRSHSECNSTSSSSTLDSTGATLATASSETLASPEEVEEEGLYIQFASHSTYPPRPLSESRLARLKYRIANAVVEAGMDSSPASEKRDPMAMAGVRASIAHMYQQKPGPSSFYSGTYGQVMSALQTAGLSTTPCKQSGFPNAHRLGALFVVNHTNAGVIELRKLTLWA